MNIRHLLGRNIRIKAISLVCAVTVWFLVTGQAETFSILGNKIIPVQVELRNAPTNLVVLDDLPIVNVELSGQNSQLTVKDVHAYIDLKDATIGRASYTVEVETLNATSSPRTVPLNIDQLSDKAMVVEAQVTGKPAAGYVAGEPILTPDEVVVRGPQSIIEKMEKVTVEINVDNAQSTLRASRPIIYKESDNLNIFAPDPGLKKVTALTGAVEIIVPIYEAGNISKKVPLNINVVGKVADGYELRSFEPLPSAVALIGPAQALDQVSSVDLGTISVDGLNGNKTFEIDTNSLTLPQGVTIVLGGKIKVLASVRPMIQQKVIGSVPVEIRNQKPNYAYSAVNPVNITVSGYPEELKEATIPSMTFWIDVAGLEAGTHSVELLWNRMPPGVTPIQVPNVTITVTAPETETEGEG